MGRTTEIEWCDSTWNPLRGCTRVSEGCRHCYAERMAARFSDVGQWAHGFAQRSPPRWTGRVEVIDAQLGIPRRWKQPRRIFVNSISDTFHERLADAAIDRVFGVMLAAPWHTYLVLTKRPERAAAYYQARPALHDLPQLWLGTSVESAAVAHRIDTLRAIPAAVRFLSLEPLIGELGAIDLSGIHWVIVGGESGPGARPMHPDWARSLRDQAKAQGVAFFMKQMARKAPIPADLQIRQWPL